MQKLVSMTIVAILSCDTFGMAQEAPKEILAEAVDKAQVKYVGWDSYLGLAVNGTTVQNRDVVGKEQGQTTTLGLKLDGELTHKDKQSLWLNSLSALTAYSRTPLLGEYVKSEDQLKLESLYKLSFSEQSTFGSFARLQGETAFFPGYSNQPELKTFAVKKLDGTLLDEESDRLSLTDAWKPLRLSESLGVFSNFLNSDLAHLDVKAGLGLRQVFAKGQLVVADDKKTSAIEVNELNDYRKAGYELGSELSGKTADKRVSYKVTANVLFPFYESPKVGDSKSGFDKRIIDVGGKLSFYLVEWASLDYVASALRDPNILAKTQLTQSFLLSTRYIFADHRKE